MQRRKSAIFWAVLFAAGIFLARPDRLFSSPVPSFDDEARASLAAVSAPMVSTPEETINRRLSARIREISGVLFTEGTVRDGEILDQILRRGGASGVDAHAFVRELRPVLDPRTVRPGDRYQLWVDRTGEILQLEYRRGPIEVYRSVREGEGWLVSRADIPVERREREICGVLSGSLWESFTQAGGEPDLIMAFVELFGWDVDFAHESQAGDEFRVIYEALFAEGTYIGNGRILAASYRDRDETHAAVYYESEKTKGYYDAKGSSVRKSFLRSPVQYSRISSGFSYKRRHPVSHVVKPHLGVDFAAPIGTPVWAVADGTVTCAARKGGGGNQVTLRHAMGYESSYLHLSRFAKGVRPGTRVQQGQTIGYVGSTGISTGPHLDYRLRKDGVWVNPLRHNYEPGPPVPADERGRFDEYAALWFKRLDALEFTINVAERML